LVENSVAMALRRRVGAAVAVCVLLGTWLAGCGGPRRPLVMLIGLDGACWEVIDLLIERGELTTFARMKRDGAWGSLECLPPLSPPSWTSLATGRVPEAHGIVDWGVRTEAEPRTSEPCALASYRYIPINASMMTHPRLWDIASDAGRTVAVANWLFTWPVKPVNGYMVADWTAQSRRQRYYPEDLEERLLPTLKAVLSGDESESPARFAERDAEVRGAFLETERLLATAHFLLGAEHPTDLLAVGFYFTNNMQHRYWHCLYPDYYRVEQEEAERYADVIPKFHRMMDRFLEPYVEDPEITVMVFSDHGMTGLRDETVVNLDSDVGFRVLWEEILEAAGLLVRQGGNVDWGRSRAYLKAYEDRSGICLNLMGREDTGIVSQDQFLPLRSEVADSLRNVRLEETGEPVFVGVREGGCFDVEVTETMTLPWGRHRSLQESGVLLWGKRYPFSRFFRWKDRYAAHGEGIMIQESLAGREGILLLHGPTIGRGVRLEGARNVDFAPTALYLLGLPAARDMDGDVLTAAMRPDVLKREPPDYVDTYGSMVPPGQAPEIPPDGREALMARLRELGYLE
jgi:predicted AlkP superfamily phosphohydrolase/phosphomutase